MTDRWADKRTEKATYKNLMILEDDLKNENGPKIRTISNIERISKSEQTQNENDPIEEEDLKNEMTPNMKTIP